MNPWVPQSSIDAHMADDSAKARAEYFAEFRANVAGLVSQAVVDAAVIPDRYELPYVEGLPYTAFTDVSGGSADSMSLSIAHAEGDVASTRRAITDLVREVQPPFSPDAVVAEFAETLKAYGLTEVWSDSYAAQWPRERFAVHGIIVRYPHNTIARIKSTSDIYRELLPALNSGRVELLDNERLITQLCQLERHAVAGGREDIRHPSGGHDDLINAAAGALVMALNVVQETKTFPVPFVAGTPRYIPGGSALGTPVVGCPGGIIGEPFVRPGEEWKRWVNSDGSIRSRPWSPWDI
jgi:hypothetical protein